LILFLYLRSRFGNFWRVFDSALFKAQLSNAIPFGLGALVYATQANLHNYFVSHYFSPAEFAVYAIGCFELPLLNLLVDAVVSVLLPEVARREGLRDYEGIVGVWASAVRKLAFFFIPAYTLLFVLRREFITFVFTKNYEAAVPIFAVNLLAILLFISVPTSIIRAFDDLKYFRLKLSIAMLPVAFIVLYVGINAAGMVGAIGAFVLVQTVDLGIIVAKIGRRLQMSIRDLRRLAPILRTTLAATIAGASAFLVKVALADASSPVKLVVCGTVFGVVHLTVAFAAGAVTDEEKIELRGAMVRFYRLGSSRLGFSRT
jgi:O-antigen/teichoic acid export membrane protein